MDFTFTVMDENDIVLATLHGEVTSINIEGSPTTLSTTPAQQETVVSSSDDASDTRPSHEDGLLGRAASKDSRFGV
ncbi:hypothetical protein GE061_005234 [Apolygus lucorum]|uniref:Uncharacterized protein n=1 Tax=Apolygus lucorum TaxID=248454 RepID=A0A6A4J4D2_APOLU|nr:hypothetical protein GE061_005234 [Apolygus lucorum]